MQTRILVAVLLLVPLGCASAQHAVPGGVVRSGTSSLTQSQQHRYMQAWSRPASVVPPNGVVPSSRLDAIPTRVKRPGKAIAAYVGTFWGLQVLSYPGDNRANDPPQCSVPSSYVNNVAVDGKGNLIVPNGSPATVVVYQGPGNCGPEIGIDADYYGQASDAWSENATKGKIYVANIFSNGGNGAGSLSVCTIAGGCTQNITDSNIWEAVGVTGDSKGNVYLSGFAPGSSAVLIYFAKGKAPGKVIDGYRNIYPGGLGFDRNGNLVALDAFTPSVHVYSGCPACTEVSGSPWPLRGHSVFGGVGTIRSSSASFYAANVETGEIDVYQYPGFTYSYSFDNGLSTELYVEGAAPNPRAAR